MGERPTSEHSIERKDNNADYCPDNCVWATKVSQATNRRTTRFITASGKTLSVSQWARETGIGITTIRQRIRLGWPPELAVATLPDRATTCGTSLRYGRSGGFSWPRENGQQVSAASPHPPHL